MRHLRPEPAPLLITGPMQRALVWVICAVLLFPADLCAASLRTEEVERASETVAELPLLVAAMPQSPQVPAEEEEDPQDGRSIYLDAELAVPEDDRVEGDSLLTVVVDEKNPYGLDGKIPFDPNPNRAVWMSALFPGLGQIYNRRYWKLPIIVGGFMGLGYAASWNNNQYQDYSQGYRDLLDADPSTNSYMNFFPPNTSESDLDSGWLSQTMKSRKDYYRRNRDLCIICLVALYLVCMLDAYVDASMAHFDISPDLSLDVSPAMFITPANRRPAVGLNWAFTF